jgi:hypothetical protein
MSQPRSQVVHEIPMPGNPRETIRVVAGSVRGEPRLAAWVFAKCRDGEWRPAKGRGLSLPPGMWAEVMLGIARGTAAETAGGEH